MIEAHAVNWQATASRVALADHGFAPNEASFPSPSCRGR